MAKAGKTSALRERGSRAAGVCTEHAVAVGIRPALDLVTIWNERRKAAELE